MSLLTESITKLSQWITSSPPVGKRKTVRWVDEDVDESTDYDSELSSSGETDSDAGSSAGIDEKHIQEQLEEESRQEYVDDVQPQEKPATAGRTKVVSETRHVTFEPTVDTSMPQWADKPNTRARQLLKQNFNSPAAILEDLKEPEYACRDIEIRDRVVQMMDQIETLAREHFGFELKDKTRLQTAFESMPEETVKIIDYVTSNGRAGASGWDDIFLDSDKRQALICALISNVLIEQVFQHIFFGGTQSQIKQLAETQHPNNFTLNTLHASAIRNFLAPNPATHKTTTHTLHLPPTFTPHTTHITAALLTHLTPILALHHPTPPAQSLAVSSLISSLHPITIYAALLSLSMRIDMHTVYRFAPPVGEEGSATPPRGGCSIDEREGLVRITIFPGLTAWRAGGWEENSRLGSGGEEEDGCEDGGVRCRQLMGEWVDCW